MIIGEFAMHDYSKLTVQVDLIPVIHLLHKPLHYFDAVAIIIELNSYCQCNFYKIK